MCIYIYIFHFGNYFTHKRERLLVKLKIEIKQAQLQVSEGGAPFFLSPTATCSNRHHNYLLHALCSPRSFSSQQSTVASCCLDNKTQVCGIKLLYRRSCVVESICSVDGSG